MDFGKVKKTLRKNALLILCLVIYVLTFAFFTFIYYKRLAAFGCSDDCFNYVGGYLINKGKTIYSGFFFNHDLLMPFLSASIQKITKPTTIYNFILYHKLFLFAFSFVMGILTIIRFRTAAFLALILYEATKFYVFGDHFLGEAFVVYPLIYMLGLVWEKWNKRPIHNFDIILSSFFCWFVVFAREPYIPLALILYLIILFGKNEKQTKIISVAIFGILSVLTLIKIPLADFFTNIYTYNKLTINNEFNRNGISGFSLFNIFLYPFKVFTEGVHNLFREILVVVSFVFLTAGAIYSFVLRRKAFLFLFLIIGISNIRPVTPGLIYYEAFHINVWFALLVFSAFLLVVELYRSKKTIKASYIFLGLFTLLALRLLTSPLYFVKEHPDRVTEFNTNYGTYYAYGTVIKTLSDKNDTMFLEDKDELIHWVADLNSPYKYSWYTSHMPIIPKYKEARDEMFAKNPPDFYYDACVIISKRSWLPFGKTLEGKYTRLFVNGNKSCLLVRNSKLKQITPEAWQKASELGFSLPKS